MKGLKTILVILLVGLLLGSVAYILQTEALVQVWEARVRDADSYFQMVETVEHAQRYSKDLQDALRVMANENGLLCERDAKMVKVVAVYDEENQRLKAALKEAIEKLQDQQKELNEVYDEIGRLQYKIQCLEKALELIPTPADPDTDVSTDPLDNPC
ncbi:MAG: hypothetical protein DRH04_07305 [Deltaproteobacteria bacterium]|nr:MAG: hypothetical protein DRH04_07305 [Deltaproteobacteria bacterium]